MREIEQEKVLCKERYGVEWRITTERKIREVEKFKKIIMTYGKTDNKFRRTT